MSDTATWWLVGFTGGLALTTSGLAIATFLAVMAGNRTAAAANRTAAAAEAQLEDSKELIKAANDQAQAGMQLAALTKQSLEAESEPLLLPVLKVLHGSPRLRRLFSAEGANTPEVEDPTVERAGPGRHRETRGPGRAGRGELRR